MNTANTVLRTLAKSLRYAAEEVERIDKAIEVIKAEVAREQKEGRATKAKSARRAPSRKGKKDTATAAVMAIISRSKNGVDTATLEKKTGFSSATIRNIIFRLKKQGKIKNLKRGVYIKA